MAPVKAIKRNVEDLGDSVAASPVKKAAGTPVAKKTPAKVATFAKGGTPAKPQPKTPQAAAQSPKFQNSAKKGQTTPGKMSDPSPLQTRSARKKKAAAATQNTTPAKKPSPAKPAVKKDQEETDDLDLVLKKQGVPKVESAKKPATPAGKKQLALPAKSPAKSGGKGPAPKEESEDDEEMGEEESDVEGFEFEADSDMESLGEEAESDDDEGEEEEDEEDEEDVDSEEVESKIEPKPVTAPKTPQGKPQAPKSPAEKKPTPVKQQPQTPKTAAGKNQKPNTPAKPQAQPKSPAAVKTTPAKNQPSPAKPEAAKSPKAAQPQAAAKSPAKQNGAAKDAKENVRVLPEKTLEQLKEYTKTLKDSGMPAKEVQQAVAKRRRALLKRLRRKGNASKAMCYKCGSEDHKAVGCPKKDATLAFINCFTCKEKGHVSKNCPKKTEKKAEQKSQPPAPAPAAKIQKQQSGAKGKKNVKQ